MHVTDSPHILHLDLDCFFVSVERLLDPNLVGKPVIVGAGARGVVSSASYEARKYGVHSAMPVFKARKLCPQGIFLNGSYGEYSTFSRRVRDIVADAVPLLEVASIDEMYADLSGLDRFVGAPFPYAQALRRHIFQATGLPLSFGLASSKTLAKMATNAAKPSGELYLPPGTERAWLAPRPIGEIPGLGAVTEKTLEKRGIRLIAVLQAAGPVQLQRWLGVYGPSLWRKSMGLDHRPLSPHHVRKSLGHETTFSENITQAQWLRARLVALAEKVAHELRVKGFLALGVGIKLKYSDFECQTRQATLPATANDEDLIRATLELFDQHWQRGRPLRLIGVRAAPLTHSPRPVELFEDPAKARALHAAVDGVKTQFGQQKLCRAVTLRVGAR